MGKQRFSKEVEVIISGFAEELKGQNQEGFRFTNEILKPLAEKIIQQTGQEINLRRLRFSLMRRLGVAVPPRKPKEGISSEESGSRVKKSLAELSAKLAKLSRIADSEIAVLKREYNIKLAAKEKEIQRMKEENRKLLELLRGLKKIQAAAEELNQNER